MRVPRLSAVDQASGPHSLPTCTSRGSRGPALKPPRARAPGGGQGIGRAFAHALGEAGAAVAVVDVVRATAEATAAELAAKGVRSLAVVADITRAADCERCVPRPESPEACRAAAFSIIASTRHLLA